MEICNKCGGKLNRKNHICIKQRPCHKCGVFVNKGIRYCNKCKQIIYKYKLELKKQVYKSKVR